MVAVSLGAMKMAMVDASSYSRQPWCSPSDGRGDFFICAPSPGG